MVTFSFLADTFSCNGGGASGSEAAGAAEGYRIVDVSLQPSIDSAPYVNLSKIAGEVEGLAKDERLLLVCAKGKRAYMAQNRMKFYGYTNTKALEGGTAFNEIDAEN